MAVKILRKLRIVLNKALASRKIKWLNNKSVDYNNQPETLAEYLIMTRNDMNLSQVQVSEMTRIPLKYLSALENSTYSSLPADVYVVGFLAKLAKLYEADSQSLVEQFKFERELNLSQVSVGGRKKRNKPSLNLSITPKFLSLLLGSLVIFSTLVWLFWQIVGINTKPFLEIYGPSTGSVINGSVVVLKGKTDPGAILRINKETVFVDKEGFFEATLSLSSGQNELMVESSNKFDKTTTQNLTVVADLPERVSENETIEANKTFKVEIFVEKDLPISITLDGKIVPTEIFPAKTSKAYEVKDKIVLLTPDAGNTSVKINDKALGVLGKKGEVLTVPFASKDLDVIMKTTNSNK